MNIYCIENVFTVQDLRATCTCPDKLSVPWKFSLNRIHFLHSGFLSNLRLPWKTECALKIFTLVNVLFTIHDFLAALRLPWKTELPCIHCIEYIFYIQEFLATSTCPEKQSVPWKFLLYWIYFLHSGYFSTLRLAWKQSLPWKFSSPGGGTPHPPPRTPMCAVKTFYWV